MDNSTNYTVGIIALIALGVVLTAGMATVGLLIWTMQ